MLCVAFYFSGDMEDKDEEGTCSIYPVCCYSTLCMHFIFFSHHRNISTEIMMITTQMCEITNAAQTFCNAQCQCCQEFDD